MKNLIILPFFYVEKNPYFDFLISISINNNLMNYTYLILKTIPKHENQNIFLNYFYHSCHKVYLFISHFAINYLFHTKKNNLKY